MFARRAYVAAMSRRVGDYRPHDAEDAVLYRVIDEHLVAFLETTRRQAEGVPLPAFVEREFRDFLTCGVLAHGFARLRCTECALERLVPFSCKGRGFCPSCGGRRMTEGAARLVDGVLPRVPVRQWVLSLPYRLRYLLAWDHGLARAVLTVAVRVLLGFQRQRARGAGIRNGRSGSVTVIQRFGGGLNLNVHFHTLLLDVPDDRNGLRLEWCQGQHGGRSGGLATAVVWSPRAEPSTMRPCHYGVGPPRSPDAAASRHSSTVRTIASSITSRGKAL